MAISLLFTNYFANRSKKRLILLSLTLTLFFFSSTSIASTSFSSMEKGWFWGEREIEEERGINAEQAKEIETEIADQDKEQNCSNPLEWTIECGFVHPQRDFDFSQLQYKELTKQLAMYPEDVSKVLQYQKFVHWAVDQAVTASKSAEWNIIQNQDMNPFIDNPVGSFGMRAAALALTDHNKTVMQDIAEQDGFLVMFTRNDCVYCHKMYPVNSLLAENAGLDLYAAALDGTCLPKFTQEFCYDDTEKLELLAQYLDVFMVPDLFLYLPKDDVWIRVSSGVEEQSTISRRIISFFGAAKSAAQKGMKNVSNINRPAVDFKSKDINQRAKLGIGVAEGILKEVGNEKHN